MSRKPSIVKQYADLRADAAAARGAIARVIERDEARIKEIEAELRGCVGVNQPIRVFDAGPGLVVVVKRENPQTYADSEGQLEKIVTVNVAVVEKYPRA